MNYIKSKTLTIICIQIPLKLIFIENSSHLAKMMRGHPSLSELWFIWSNHFNEGGISSGIQGKYDDEYQKNASSKIMRQQVIAM